MHWVTESPWAAASIAAIVARFASPESRAALRRFSNGSKSTEGRAAQTAKTKGRFVQRCHSSPRSQTVWKPPLTGPIARSPIKSTASAFVDSINL